MAGHLRYAGDVTLYPHAGRRGYHRIVPRDCRKEEGGREPRRPAAGKVISSAAARTDEAPRMRGPAPTETAVAHLASRTLRLTPACVHRPLGHAPLAVRTPRHG
jgi:hypothetical protein